MRISDWSSDVCSSDLKTLTVRGLELTDENEQAITRALRLISTHADSNGLTVDAVIYPIEENIISRYLTAGFIVHHQADGEHGEAICPLIRLAQRNGHHTLDTNASLRPGRR